MQRSKQFLLRLTPDEHRQFQEESEKLGISISDFMRLLFRQWVNGIRFERDKYANNGSVNNNGKG